MRSSPLAVPDPQGSPPTRPLRTPRPRRGAGTPGAAGGGRERETVVGLRTAHVLDPGAASAPLRPRVPAATSVAPPRSFRSRGPWDPVGARDGRRDLTLRRPGPVARRPSTTTLCRPRLDEGPWDGEGPLGSSSSGPGPPFKVGGKAQFFGAEDQSPFESKKKTYLDDDTF